MKYELPRDGMDDQIARERATAEQIRDLSGANNLESAVATGPTGFTVYDPATGGRAQFFQGRIRFWDDYDTNPTEYGEILVDPGAGLNYLRLYPPHSSGSGAENSVTIQGRRSGSPGNFWVYTDGQLLLDAGGPAFISGDSVNIDGDDINLTAPTVKIDTPQLPLYSLPTTSSGANLHLGTVGGQWTVAYVTSSQRYKQDRAPAAIDPDAVLRWVPRTWRDKAEVEAIGDDAAEHIGFIAEEIHAETPEFVVLDDEGRPDSLKYDRMVVGLHAVVKQQAEQIAALTARLEALEAS